MSDSITALAIKKLYGRSAGKCNICKVKLFEEHVHIGEMAHVIAKKPNGPRGDVSQSNDNSYENLILLCSNDHTRVDNDPIRYTVDYLHTIKREHEEWIDSATDFSGDSLKKRKSDVDFLNAYFQFTPFTRLRSLVDSLPHSFNLDFYMFEEQFQNALKGFPAHYPLYDTSLHDYFDGFIVTISNIERIINGYVPMPNGGRAEIYHSVNGNQCFINSRDINPSTYATIENELNDLKGTLEYYYSKLIEYIRKYYSEIELESRIV